MTFLRKIQAQVFGKTTRAALVRCLIFVLGFYVMFHQLFEAYTVYGPSMEDTLKQDQIIWVNKYHYNFYEPQLYDIVVIKDVVDSGTMIKRLIGMPGDTVEILHGIVLINGMPDNYCNINDDEYDDYFLTTTLGENEYFYHGDNRYESVCGIITRDDIIGKVVIPSKSDYTTR